MKRNLSKLFSFLTLLILLPLSACGDEPFAAPMTIVVFGDSLTAGYRLPADKAFPAQLEARLHAEGYTGIRVINQGISGDNTRGGVARMHTATALQPDIIILELGANDILGRSPASRAEPQLRKLIEAFEQSGALVLLTGIEVPGIFPGAALVAEYETLFETLADEYDLIFYPHFLDGVMSKPDLNLDDRLHPNAQGVAKIVDGILPAVKKALHERLEKRGQ